MPSLDWDKVKHEDRAFAERPQGRGTVGDIVLESWFDGSGKKQAKTYATLLDAVRAAWQGRPATISTSGVLSVRITTKHGPATLKHRIRAHGAYVSSTSWRAMKAELQRRAAAAAPGTVDARFT